eukprot:1182057-Prorocentrum_minimum.AAC.1
MDKCAGVGHIWELGCWRVTVRMRQRAGVQAAGGRTEGCSIGTMVISPASTPLGEARISYEVPGRPSCHPACLTMPSCLDQGDVLVCVCRVSRMSSCLDQGDVLVCVCRVFTGLSPGANCASLSMSMLFSTGKFVERAIVFPPGLEAREAAS